MWGSGARGEFGLDATQTQQLPQTLEGEILCAPSPEETSSLPVVVAEAPHRSRLHRATNLLALGQAHEAANLCREELADFPESGDAYALLSMAEEQSGRRALAIELLQELLRLDPSRSVEAEHLAELQREQEEVEAEQPTEEEKQEQIRRLQPVALLMLAAAAICLLASLIALGVAHHHRTQALGAYNQAMATGYYNLQYHFYPQAADAYAQALRLYPDDPAARARYAQAVQAAEASGQPVSAAPTVSLDPNNSPFPPVGPMPPAGAVNALAGAGPFPAPQSGSQAPPSVRGNERTGNTEPAPDWGNPTPPEQGQGPIVAHLNTPITPPTATRQPATGTSAAGAAPAETPAAPATPPEQITIERTDHPAPPEDAWQKGDELRSQGVEAQGQGQYGAAAKSFRGAIKAYESAKAQHPDHERAINGEIATLQARIRVCEKHAQ